MCDQSPGDGKDRGSTTTAGVTFQPAQSAAQFRINYLPLGGVVAETEAFPPRSPGTEMTARGAVRGINMNTIDVAEDLVDRMVDELFGGASFRHGEFCENPVTGGGFVYGFDPIGPQKLEAYRALFAREWFALNAPADAQPLPLSYQQREACKGYGLLRHIVKWYARSLEGRNYDVKEHPSFADYVSGVLWEAGLPAGERFAFLPDYPLEDILALKKRFPPRMLKGMSSWAQWLPPKLHAKEIEYFRRRSSNPEVYFKRE